MYTSKFMCHVLVPAGTITICNDNYTSSIAHLSGDCGGLHVQASWRGAVVRRQLHEERVVRPLLSLALLRCLQHKQARCSTFKRCTAHDSDLPSQALRLTYAATAT